VNKKFWMTGVDKQGMGQHEKQRYMNLAYQVAQEERSRGNEYFRRSFIGVYSTRLITF